MGAIVRPAAGSVEVRAESLFDGGRTWVFPCDATGRVDLDALPPCARSNYLRARALLGRGFVLPQVCASRPDARA